MGSAETSPTAGILRIEKWCAEIGVSKHTGARWRRENGLPVVKVGKQVWVDVVAANAWLRSHTVVAGQKQTGKAA